MRNKFFLVTALIILLTLFVQPAGATSIRILSLEEMVQSADRVFRGRCVSTREVPGVGNLLAVEYTFDVSEGVKGTTTGQTVVFRQMRSAQPGKHGIAGIPAFREGEDLLIFLHGDSRLGLTSPVGFSQGVFRILPGGAEGVRAVNGVDNRNLMMGAISPASDLGLSGPEVTALSRGGDLPLRTLTAAIRKIDRFQGARSGSAQ